VELPCRHFGLHLQGSPSESSSRERGRGLMAPVELLEEVVTQVEVDGIYGPVARDLTLDGAAELALE